MSAEVVTGLGVSPGTGVGVVRLMAPRLGPPRPHTLTDTGESEAAGGVPELREPTVLIARDLSAADAAGLDPDLVAGLITEAGGPMSHTSIVARSLGIPAVVAAGATALRTGMRVRVDGGTGRVRVADVTESPARARGGTGRTTRRRRHPHRRRIPCRTPRQRRRRAGAAEVAACEADGIGLFRTELAFRTRTRQPSIEVQARLYSSVLAEVPERKVILRTLDTGTDTTMPPSHGLGERNPALGVRGYRATTNLLEDQARAIAIAARVQDVDPWVMAPMISTPAEARGFRMIARRYGISRAGVMIEVPAARDGRRDPRRMRLRLDRDERPHAVHHGDRQGAWCRGRAQRSVATRGSPPRAHRRRGGNRARQTRRGVRRGGRRPAPRMRARRTWCDLAVDVAAGTARGR
ncbi:hypothetical protein IOD13_16545 [Brevibacterium casei]|nr:hypothetical protein [Brevibacterium casei]